MSAITKPYYTPSQTSSGSSGGGGIRGSIKSSGSGGGGANLKIRSSSQNSNQIRKSAALSMTCDDLIEIKSKFDAEFRRFSISRSSCVHDMKSFRKLVENLHNLTNVPFTLCYTDTHGDLLPINNDENFKKALESARPVLRLLVQRKGESLEERYGYGTTDSLKKRNRISRFLGNVGAGGLVPVVGGAASLLIAATPQRQYDISMPQDFRQVSAIIDVDVVPETHRRVRLCKHGSDKPLGFYIRDGTSVRVTSQGLIKVPGIFISRLVPGGLAESTGLLAINDEVLEVNGIEVLGKNLDQVTDMMVANASNLIITVRPADQRLTLARNSDSRTSGQSSTGIGAGTDRRSTADNRSSSLNDEDSDDEVDEIKDMITSNM